MESLATVFAMTQWNGKKGAYLAETRFREALECLFREGCVVKLYEAWIVEDTESLEKTRLKKTPCRPLLSQQDTKIEAFKLKLQTPNLPP